MGETVKETKQKKTNKQKKSWFKGLKQEFSKIIWPDRESLVKETTAVLFVSVLLGVIIFVVDLVARFGIEFLVR
jgi:preprotein translocase subunit SecE